MYGSSDTDIFDFLAEKILTGDREKQKEVLFFWADLIAGDFERNLAMSSLDSEDRAYIQETVEIWFRRTLVGVICDLKESDKDPEVARLRIQKAVTARVRNIIKDLLFEKKTSRNKDREKGCEPSEPPVRICRTTLRMSHMNPEIQDTVFMDASADAETQFLHQELLLSQKQVLPGATGSTIVDEDGGAAAVASEDIMGFLAKQAHLETLRARMANTRHTGKG